MLALWMTDAVASITEGGNFVPHATTLGDRLLSFAGLFFFCFLAWLISEKRRQIVWRPVLWGLGLQLLLGLVVLSPWLKDLFLGLNVAVDRLMSFSNAGAAFAFRSIEPHFIDVPTSEGAVVSTQFAGQVSPPLKNFAFWILPTIIFFSTLMGVLYHLGVMQLIVRGTARIMMVTMGTSGAETLSMAGNIFLGQTEAPLLVRPYLPTMTRSELMAVMVGGFATVAGGVLGAYVGFLQRAMPDIAGHIIVASIMSAPAGFAMSKIVVPETEEPVTKGDSNFEFPATSTNVIEAGANGASEGMKLALNVAAMLIAAVAMIALLDYFVGFIPLTRCETGWTAGYACAAGAPHALTTSDILGWVFSPAAFFMGVPWSEAGQVGALLGEKMILTEFTAYQHLGEIVTSSGPPVMSTRTAVIISYALCGFSNFASIGIQIGGIGGMAEERQREIASLGIRAMLAGTLANCMTGCVVGIII